MYSTVLQYLEDTAAKFPNKIAFDDTKESISFASLMENAKRIGSFISKQVKPHNPIVIFMDKRAYNINYFMGAVYAGCFYVPIDSQMPAERINLILGTLNPSMIIYDDVTAKRIDQLGDQYNKVYYKDSLAVEIDESSLDTIRKYSKNTDLLYVLFTSGSTGVPKGVTLSHLAIIDCIDWMCDAYSLDETTTMCNQAPFYFDVSMPDIYISLKAGATVYIPPKSYYTFPKKILQFIEDKHINTLCWVPSALCNVVNCRAFEVCVPSELKLVLFCGEVMPCKHLNVWRKYVPDALYVNMYGPTEAAYACMYYNVDRDFDDDDKLPLGKACENSEILLITDDSRVANPGEMGEICILGQCLSNGYYGAKDKTDAAFVQNPTNDKWIELMYRTGDLAYVDEKGDIMFAGRKDFQIKRLGHRIELGEIENAILSIEGIENACCIFNEENSDIIAVYTGKVPAEEVGKELNAHLPHYMIPNRYENLDVMPMNLNGKIDRPKLKKEYTEA